MKLTDFYTEVARLADNNKQKISVSETSRVLAVAFQVLSKVDSATAFDLISKGITTAQKKVKK